MCSAAMAENTWIVGRELIRHGRDFEGRVMLRQVVMANPSVRWLALLATSYRLDCLPVS